ncbi:phosphoinositide 3-kinase adapter protein 1 [Notolabrus celidotus]|uniref:phosphoinositide 3-kinase adapter protein 1 n=1 Tax=Notolabrus celidotus TaxID=1203425 RepID=UPI0014905AF5|nr:phosphoinositide 3-kinase adapter protein 1 [Notolabrus celidotus]
MEAPALRSESANPESLPDYGILILHTADAQEWAQYLQQILDSSRKFHEWSILLHAVVPAEELPGNQFEYFQSCKCILLLLTGSLLDMLCDRELQAELQRLLHPPHRVVVLLCGVSEDQVLSDTFEDWLMWRKISAEDEPAVYVSTILDSLNDNRHVEAEQEIEAVAETQFDMTEASPAENLITDKMKKVTSGEQKEHLQEDDELITNNSTNGEINAPGQLTCLTVQPNRVQCREQVNIFIILTHKVQSAPEVEFSSENVSTKRVPGTLENEYTISVSAPDMPAGVMSLTLYVGRSCLSLQPVTYYTAMGEISRLLDNASDPVHFMCQAFNLMSNATESLDNMLTDSLKSRMPGNSLQLFGNKQIEENNMAACQRNEEFPTLLHFAAKYGLKKLTTILLQCPGALQAYSVMNKHGDYPNTLAQKSGFSDLRQFMDEFVETAVMLKSHFEDTVNTEESTADVYELMSDNSRDIIIKYSGCSEDIYESMLDLDPECAEDLYESMNAVDENPQEAMLRKFFQAKQHACANPASFEHLKIKEEEKADQTELDQIEEEEDPYKLVPEDIYDTVDANSTYDPRILNRPPAPIPRPDPDSEPDRPVAYISRVFTEKGPSQQETVEVRCPEAQPDADPLSPDYDPYAGMKTPGQRQLISLQERVKVGEITVNEAVQEFKAWQFDHERRANSIRYQQENLKKLRDSITRRHREREKTGKELDYEISAPLQRNLYWGSNVSLECSVYEPAPRVVAPPPPPPAQAIQRDTWKTGSTSSTSSSESNRLSTHSTFSYSSGTEPDFEDAVENLPPPPRPPRLSDAASFIPPPRIPPRLPERVQEKVNDRYITCPSRAAPQRPTQRVGASAPPIPRRMR